jgi:hypothetical protein
LLLLQLQRPQLLHLLLQVLLVQLLALLLVLVLVLLHSRRSSGRRV